MAVGYHSWCLVIVFGQHHTAHRPHNFVAAGKFVEFIAHDGVRVFRYQKSHKLLEGGHDLAFGSFAMLIGLGKHATGNSCKRLLATQRKIDDRFRRLQYKTKTTKKSMSIIRAWCMKTGNYLVCGEARTYLIRVHANYNGAILPKFWVSLGECLECVGSTMIG